MGGGTKERMRRKKRSELLKPRTFWWGRDARDLGRSLGGCLASSLHVRSRSTAYHHRKHKNTTKYYLQTDSKAVCVFSGDKGKDSCTATMMIQDDEPSKKKLWEEDRAEEEDGDDDDDVSPRSSRRTAQEGVGGRRGVGGGGARQRFDFGGLPCRRHRCRRTRAQRDCPRSSDASISLCVCHLPTPPLSHQRPGRWHRPALLSC